MISVIIPTYQQANFIQQAIRSVLSQSLSASEIIVINDSPGDHTYDRVKPFLSHIHYIEHSERKGASYTRNAGAEKAKGEFLAFLDGDDYWSENKLSNQYHLIQQNSEIDGVLSYVQAFHSPELDPELKLRLHCPQEPLIGYCPSALFVRKSSFLQVGGFNTELNTGEFIDWYLRATEMQFQFAIDKEATVFRRIHQAHVMKNYRDYFSILKQKLNTKPALTE